MLYDILWFGAVEDTKNNVFDYILVYRHHRANKFGRQTMVVGVYDDII